jgi:FolB domain-containing protein
MEHNGSYTDIIRIHDLKVSCIIGINEDERLNQQDIIINITLYTNLKKACKSDRIEDTVDYKNLKKNIVEMVKNSSFFLIERLSDRIAELCFRNPLVEMTTVRVEKPYALTYARTVSVEITRKRSDYYG